MTTQTYAPHPTSSTVIVDRVRQRIDDLRTPCTTTARQWVTEPGVDHLVRRVVSVTLPPLIVQLAESMAGSTSGRGSAGTRSRPPGSLEGPDTLRTITTEARYLAGRILSGFATDAVPGLRVSVRPQRLTDALAVIHRYAPDVDRESLLDVDRAVTRWWAHARIATTWETPPLKPFVPCSACGRRGTLQVVSLPLAVACLACGAAWDSMTVDELGEHLRVAVADPIPDPAPEPMPPAGDVLTDEVIHR